MPELDALLLEEPGGAQSARCACAFVHTSSAPPLPPPPLPLPWPPVPPPPFDTEDPHPAEATSIASVVTRQEAKPAKRSERMDPPRAGDAREDSRSEGAPPTTALAGAAGSV
jgi:hypothetical protein